MTVNVTFVVRVPMDELPAIVRLETLAALEVEVLTVRVDVASVVMDAGLNDAVAPAGNPVALRLIGALDGP